MTMVWTEAPIGAPLWSVDDNSDRMIGAFDPYLEWAERTNFDHLGGSRNWWVPLLIELNGISVAEFAKQAVGMEAFIRVPQLFNPPPPGLEKFPFCTVFVLRASRGEARVRNLFKNVAAVEYGVPIVAASEKSPPDKFERSGERRHPLRQMQAGFPSDGKSTSIQYEQQSIPPTAEQQWQQSQQKIDQILDELLEWPPASGLSGGVVVGIIDDAIAFANERFQCLKGGVTQTRFAGFWQQDVLSASTPLMPLGTGWTLSPAKIDALIKESTSANGRVDEEVLYRRIQHQGVGRRATHGTHVMDLAAGFDPSDGPAATTHLVGIQLPREVTRNVSGSSLTPYALLGLIYSVWLARTSTGTPLPLVVNLSYGANHGPHDGTSLFERAVDLMTVTLNSLSPPQRFCVVLPAGNSYLTRGHAKLALGNGARQTLNWRVLPDDATPSFLEIWMTRQPQGAQAKGVRIRVTAPNGVTSSMLGPGNSATLSDATGSIAVIEYDPPTLQALGKSCIRIALEPTQTVNPSGRRAPSGDWKIDLTNTGADAAIEAWIWRDDRPMGFPISGRQSRFEDPNYKKFVAQSGRLSEVDDASSPIQRAGSFNDLGTGNSMIVVGGARLSDQTVVAYSGSGPTALPGRAGPDVVAPCEGSLALHGIQAAGAISGSRVSMNGTSVAAPQVTRLVANRFQTLAKGDRNTIKGLATVLPGGPNPIRAGAGMIIAPLPVPPPSRPPRKGNRRVP